MPTYRKLLGGIINGFLILFIFPKYELIGFSMDSNSEKQYAEQGNTKGLFTVV